MIKIKNSQKICKYIAMLVGAVGLAVITTAGAVSAWGPLGRETYTMDAPADHATFNSIATGAPIGDERNFVRISEHGVEDGWVDELRVEPGKQYDVYIMYHNDASATYNDAAHNYVGVARNVRVYSKFPAQVTPEQNGEVRAVISWKNIDDTDSEVWDEATFTADTGVTMRYVMGSAKIYNGGALNGSVLPQAMFEPDGALIGYNNWDGVIPGCDQYAGHIVYTLVAEQYGASVKKSVSKDGVNFTEGDDLKVKPGDTLTYRVQFENVGQRDITNATFTDQLPNGISLINGTTTLVSDLYPEGTQLTDNLTSNGLNLGLFGPGATAILTYQAKINDDVECSTVLTNQIFVTHDVGEVTDKRTVSAEDCQGAPTIIPETGPAQIALAVVVGIAIIGGGFYLYDSQRKLDKTARRVGIASGRGSAKKTSAKNRSTAKKATTKSRTSRTVARNASTARKLTAAQKAARTRKKK